MKRFTTCAFLALSALSSCAAAVEKPAPATAAGGPPSGAPGGPASAAAAGGPASADAAGGSARADKIGELIARGRAELEAGRTVEAQKIFEQAAAQDRAKPGGSLRTRTWVLRGWIDEGRINDALDAIDALDKAGETGPAMDYLYGMAFAAKAREYIRTNVAGPAIQMSIDDAVIYLEKATKADPEFARDAFLPLAEAAWFGQRLDIGRTAAEGAVKRTPENPDAYFMLGRIALSRFSALKDQAGDDPAKQTQADADWETARAAFAKSAELLVKAGDPARADVLARVRTNLGHAYVWKDQLDLATKEYALGIVAMPSVVDMRQIRGALGAEKFLATLEEASKELTARPGTTTEDLAAVSWWLGWARYDRKEYDKADDAFSAAVAKNAEFVNAWFYIAMSRFHRQDMDGALAAFQRHFDEDPSDLVASLDTDRVTNLGVLDAMIGWFAEKQRSAEAAFLCELQAHVAPEESRYWNNVGLFWRDAGEALAKSDRPEDKTLANEWFEKSWAAYEKALSIEPDNPAFLNDAAVILHYYLDRDLEKAREMYERSTEQAKIELARPDLSKDARELYEIALRDSQNNLAKLERGEKTQ